MREEFASSFRLFLHIKDPLLPGIVVGKSAAMAYGGPVLRAACDELGLDPTLTMVTDLDSDFRVHPQYFAYITLQYCMADDRLVSIWQPVPVFLNNIWRVPTAVRVMATAATQWQMFLHQNPHRLVMFSSYTMPFDLLSSVGYWDSDVIPEELAVLLESVLPLRRQAQHAAGVLTDIRGCAARSRLRGNARVAVQPDQAVGMGSDQYPIRDITNAYSHPEIPWKVRARRYANLIFNHLTWATLPLLLFFGGALPAFIDLDYSLSSTSAFLGSLSASILTITLLNTLLLVQVDYRICPKPSRNGRGGSRRSRAELQLFTYPVVGLALSVIPALEAQTRLMFGAYLEYQVTEKE